ncbi:hypothetical protein [Rhodobaculum claviforme]|uniref:Glutamine amidotransferase domain-containing protein n=1 Tax=Rhodobaculum claviforme TaxID=1549854 RepID=A0A934TIX3_9RHOB|nr:hypothetical protein [Rhodobaculum claviforme]MBK5926620.1 hypothetical protein [Rhodobaculum claviforme]
MTQTILLDPLVPMVLIWVGAGLATGMVALALWRGLSGWWLRGLAAAMVLAALANPSLQTEERRALGDIVIAVVDETASNRLTDRAAQAAAALEHLEARVARLADTELRVVRLRDTDDNAGTLMMQALAGALSEEPADRIAGVVLITDGQIHDAQLAPDTPAPVHALLTGQPDDWDRRLIVRNAPAFAILGESVTLTLKVEDQGDVPPAQAGQARLSLSVNGEDARTVTVPVGEELALPVMLERGGMNVLQFEVAEAEGELTTRNNAAIVQINGVRDRLSVLLVSGEPHAGQRTWRNLLKSDASVDLVHFTILRPPDKQDGVPVSELSLIAFPTRELFIDKIDEFDLIIFDRYSRRGILPASYYDNVRRYVERGGAVLVAAGPELAGVESIWRSPLGFAFPARPTSRVLEVGFRPELSDLGRRHPVTEGLDDAMPRADDGGPGWGRWFRLVEVEQETGQAVMEGPEGRPVLILDRVGDGRLALLASDHAWLWDRGHEGGGPQLELLRRLAHWMMGEPELEEEALTATAQGGTITVTRRTLADTAAPVTVTGPDGAEVTLDLTEETPGRFAARWEAPGIGLYRLTDGTLDAVIALGPSAPREFEQTIATADTLAPLVGTTRGGALPIAEGLPDLRQVREGRAAAGRGWIGITPRDAQATTDLRTATLLPAWLWLLAAAGLALAAWLREGRASRKP